jgi:DNA-directed RNA polymerase specialized sigma24 family protein
MGVSPDDSSARSGPDQCSSGGALRPHRGMKRRAPSKNNSLASGKATTADVQQKASSPRLLFTRSSRDLLRFLARGVGFQDAADLLQETYLRVLRHAERETISDPEALLHVTAINLAKDHLRRRKTEQKYLDFEHDANGADGPWRAHNHGAIESSTWVARFERLCVARNAP